MSNADNDSSLVSAGPIPAAVRELGSWIAGQPDQGDWGWDEHCEGVAMYLFSGPLGNSAFLAEIPAVAELLTRIEDLLNNDHISYAGAASRIKRAIAEWRAP